MSDPKNSTIAFVSLLRAGAALLVVWDHLVGFSMGLGYNWGPGRFVDRYVCKPFAFHDRFGFFGVALFFLISGFIITHVAMREDRLSFGVKRLFRIYPPMMVSILLTPLVWSIGPAKAYDAFAGKDVTREMLWGLTLFDHVVPDCKHLNLATWTLLIEVMFYALCLAFLPLLKKRPVLAVAGEIAVVAFFCSKSVLGGSHSLFIWGTFTSLLPCLLLGQIAYFAWAGKFRGREFFLFSGATFYILIQAQNYFWTKYMQLDHTRMTSFAYAYGVFVIAMMQSGRIRLSKPVEWVAEISYSLYLWHCNIGQVVLILLMGQSAWVAMGAAVGAALVGSWLAWRLVEVPSQAAARWLLARVRPPKKVAAEQKPEIRLAA